MNYFTVFCFSVLIIMVNSQSPYNYKKVSSSYCLLNNKHNDRQFLMSINQISMVYCMASCSQLSQCGLLVLVNGTCQLYSKKVVLGLGASANELWYQTNGAMNVFNNSDTSLTSYWPILEQSPTDFISGQDLSSTSPTYGVDQYGSSGGSIMTTNSTNYWQAPPAVYFSGDFTVLGWIKPYTCETNARFFDFGVGNLQDNIVFCYDCLSYHPNCHPFVQIFNQGSGSAFNVYPNGLTLNQWNHVAVSLCSSAISTYLNGNFQVSVTGLSIRAVNRTASYFGKSNWNDPYSNAEYDEIKFYNRCMTPTEIAYDKASVKSLINSITL